MTGAGIFSLKSGHTLTEKECDHMNKEKEVESYLKGDLPREEKLKYEIAEELGVLDKVLENGWKSLTAKETGRIGGLMTRRRKQSEDTKKTQ